MLVVRVVLDYFFEAKHDGCAVRDKARVLKHKITKLSDEPERWRSDVKQNYNEGFDTSGQIAGLLVSGQKCLAFVWMFEEGDGSTMVMDLENLPKLSTIDTKLFEKPITVVEIGKVMSQCKCLTTWCNGSG